MSRARRLLLGAAVLVGLGLALRTLWVGRFYWPLLGQVVLWDAERAGYDSARSFTGDGYSHHRYRLPERVCAAVRADPAPLAQRPDFALGEDVLPQRWIPTPLTREALRSLEGMWYPGPMDQDPALPALTEQLERALNEPGSFAAWELRVHESEGSTYVSDLALYVLDLARCEFVLVEQNT